MLDTNSDFLNQLCETQGKSEQLIKFYEQLDVKLHELKTICFESWKTVFEKNHEPSS